MREPFSDAERLLVDLRKRTLSGGVVTTTAEGLKFLLNMATVIALARLLTPREFGLVAMASTVTAFLATLKDAGLSTATVQRDSITHGQISNLFWINVALGVVMSVIGVALAPAVAWFYQDTRLVGIMASLSLTLLLAASTVQHNALLVRHLRFTAVGTIDVGSLLFGASVAVGFALVGLGYWSLVAMQLAAAAATLVLTWSASGWRPSLPRRHSGMGSLLTFGAHMTLSSVVWRLTSGCDSMLIGRFHGAEPLGLYSRAGALLFRPLEQLLAPAGSVLLPVLSRLQSDPERYRRTFLRVYEALTLFAFSLTAILMALARPLVLTLLGPAWEGAIPLFLGFALGALYVPPAIAASWLLTTQGRGVELLHASVALSATTAVAWAIGLPFGPLGVVLAYSISGFFLRLPILYHVVGRTGPVRANELWTGFLHNLPCCIAVYLITSLARVLVDDASALTQMLVCTPVGIAIAFVVPFAFNRPRTTLRYAVAALGSQLRSRPA
jgi:O-antigen/teichoic acid export membrane protein